MDFFTFIMRILAKWPAVIAMMGAGVFFIREYYYHPKKVVIEIVSTAITVTTAWAISGLLKITIQAPRPFVNQGIENTFLVWDYTSFPSGHATIFFALATVLWLYNKRVGYTMYGAAIVIATARVLAGIHYPVDVIVGALLGITIAVVLHRIVSPKMSTIFLRKKK